MPRTQLTCKGRDRTCGVRLQIDVTSGAGPVDVACPNCGDTFSSRYVVAQTSIREPGQPWHVRSILAARHDVLVLESMTPLA